MSFTQIEISKSALKNNINSFKQILSPNTKFAAVVKSNAYGHGILEISKLALEFGADLLAVNSIEEAILLRKNFINSIILIMGEIPNLQEYKNFLNDQNLWIVCSRFESIQFLNTLSNKPSIHLKADTGMSRLGYKSEELKKLLLRLKEEKLEIQGILTHFASTEDFTEHSYTQKQIEEFKSYVQFAEDLGFKNLIKHTSASASTLLFPEAHFDLVRVGISLYGLWPSLQTRLSLSLKGENRVVLSPVLKWKTKIVHIQDIEENTYIGYGSTFKTTYPTRLAVLPVGYYEGYDRRLSNISYVLINGERARILGRVCMNMCMIDVTHIRNVKLYDEVILIGNSNKEYLSSDHLAELTNTINYQIVTNIHSDLPRIVID